LPAKRVRGAGPRSRRRADNAVARAFIERATVTAALTFSQAGSVHGTLRNRAFNNDSDFSDC
jgi:hypothetical protein